MQNLYNRFSKIYTGTSATVFVTIVAVFVVKVIQSLEMASSSDALPDALWSKMHQEFGMSAEPPSYANLLQTLLRRRADIYPRLTSLDDFKLQG